MRLRSRTMVGTEPVLFFIPLGVFLTYDVRDAPNDRIAPLFSIMPSDRLAGILLPMFSIRRRTDHGIGDLTALREWIDWAADHDVGFIQLLPVNALGSDEVPSPYSAISSVALEPLYLSLEPWLVPGLPERMSYKAGGIPGHQYPSDENLVDYTRVRIWKNWVLGRAWIRFNEGAQFEGLRDEFRAWCEEEGAWLEDFACYKVLSYLFADDCWWKWPEQNPERARCIAAGHEGSKDYVKWLQWVCARQWVHIRQYADSRGVLLMGDIPIGVSMASSDVFFQRHLFDTTWCGGAPAEGEYADDPFTAKWGQNWGIPLYRWDVMARDNYAWWRRRIRYSSHIFSMYRIDHILGFYRIYSFPWAPTENYKFVNLGYDEAARLTGGKLPGFLPRPDDTPYNRKLNLMDGDHYLQVLLAAAPGIRVVGEDLGCVPDYVRPNMKQLGIAGFKIPHWEFYDDGRIVQGGDYHHCSFATYSTHDMAPIISTWNQCYRNIAEAIGAGLFKDGKLVAKPREEDKETWHCAQVGLNMLNWFADYCAKPENSMISEWNDSAKNDMFRALFRSNSDYVALMWTELFDIDKRLNVPGTVGGTNWRWRMSFNAFDALEMPQSAWLKGIIDDTKRIPRTGKDGLGPHTHADALPFPTLLKSRDDIMSFFMLNPFGRSM